MSGEKPQAALPVLPGLSALVICGVHEARARSNKKYRLLFLLLSFSRLFGPLSTRETREDNPEFSGVWQANTQLYLGKIL
jgi:hypothetical protein